MLQAELSFVLLPFCWEMLAQSQIVRYVQKGNCYSHMYERPNA